jgi:hypothetical protein
MKAALITPIECLNYYIEMPTYPNGTGNATNLISMNRLKDEQLMVYYLNMLFEYSRSDNGHHYLIFNPNLLTRIESDKLPEIGVWIDQTGTIDKLLLNGNPISFIKESNYHIVTCAA